MHLFAIIAKVDDTPKSNQDESIIKSTAGVRIVEGFLKSELSSEHIQTYISIFENYLISTRGSIFEKGKAEKRNSLQSVKMLKICAQINKELTQLQKTIVLVRIMEFLHLGGHITEQEYNFFETVSESFHISNEECNKIKYFVGFNGIEYKDEENILYYSSKYLSTLKQSKYVLDLGLDQDIIIIQIKSIRCFFFKYIGKDELFVNGQLVTSNKVHIFNIGSTVRTTKSNQLYYSDVVSKLNKLQEELNITLEANNIIHSFRENQNAIHTFKFSTNGGQIIGLMGQSGSGKTTLTNILNGKLKPKYGTVKINGIDLHNNEGELNGVIGNISQDDLLVDELTVFENLYFSAELSIHGISKAQLIRNVNKLLHTLGLFEIRRLKVGSIVQKVISGGQRKRLNIALELIREPSILFVDEPTSGLSSKDSDNIMDLLKELSLSGKLVFVVIHQPSSNIFKLFDRLLILDKGGYLIYDGIPLNAIVHFKTYSFHGNAHERECTLCGNVNPENIFNLIDAKTVDEFGIETDIRKHSPIHWNKKYKEHRETYSIDKYNVKELIGKRVPSRTSQLFSYLRRDFLAKKSNNQYILINLLISPVLAFTLAYFIKYSGWNDNSLEYSYYFNDNIPQYIFMAVIVAIFIGMSVSAEEILKDKKNLMREKFINLSRSSYLLSKIAILFIISAIQAALFTLIGNWILEIKGMMFQYWLVLFSTACLSNLIGLNISSAFNSAKVIYIFVPLLIIPQLLFSGVIVPFNKLNSGLSEVKQVPLIGNLMPSRWAYEALIVEQTSQNKLSRDILHYHIHKSQSEWKRNYWVPEIRNQLRVLLNEDSSLSKRESAQVIISNELEHETNLWASIQPTDLVQIIKHKPFTIQSFRPINLFLEKISNSYLIIANNYSDSIQQYMKTLGQDNFKRIRSDYRNIAIQNIVENKFEIQKLIIHDHKIFQMQDPIFNLPPKNSFFKSHYYSPYKYIFGFPIKTYSINVLIIWIMIFIGYIILYLDLVKKLLWRIPNFRIFKQRKLPYELS